MGRHDDWRQWGAYALALLPLLFLEGLVFWRISFPLAHPFLLPFAISMVSSREGVIAGAGYGLLVGFFALLLGHGSSMLFLCSLVGAVVALLFERGLQQGFFGCLFGGMVSSLLLALLRMLRLSLWKGASFWDLMSIAAPEFLWSLLFFPLVYGLYLLPARRVRVSKGGLAA